MTKHKLTYDDIPDIISGGLGIIQEELQRIAAIPVDDRKPADIKLTLSCITALTAADKNRQAEEKQAAIQINMLPPETIRQIAGVAQPLQIAKTVPDQDNL